MKNTFIFATLTVSSVASTDDKCRALAMSGGANYGAWEAGIMWGLTHYGNPEDYAWDVITGVSAGAINTAATTMFNVGDEVKMSEFISNTWQILTTHDIWVEWPEGPVAALLNKQGLVDSSPALNFITQTLQPFGQLSDRKFTIAAANVDTGKYELFTQDNITFEEMPQAALSSGSIPTVFPNQHFKGMNLMDGGTIWNINVDAAINQCLDMGYAQADIIVDVLICDSAKSAPEADTGKTINNLMQAYQIHGANNGMNAVGEQERAYPDVNYRYYLTDEPTDSCNVWDLLDFNNSTTWCLQEAGRQEAKSILEQRSLEEWEHNQEVMKAKAESSIVGKVKALFKKLL